MKVKFKKLSKNAVLPSYAKPGDAGLDMTAISKKVVDEKKYGYIEYSTGLAVEIPEGFAGFLLPRSSVSETGLILANSVGLIDSGYRGEIKFRYKAIPDTYQYEIGDRVGQLVILPYPIIDVSEESELSESERGSNGYGSTGK
jgi:dUTP pyrophosphatase